MGVFTPFGCRGLLKEEEKSPQIKNMARATLPHFKNMRSATPQPRNLIDACSLYGATGNDQREHVYRLNSGTVKVVWDTQLPKASGAMDSGFVFDAKVCFKVLMYGTVLMAIQSSSGKILWQSEWVQSPTQGSPKPPPALTPTGVLMHGSGVETNRFLHGVSAANGTALWKIRTDAPVVANALPSGNQSA